MLSNFLMNDARWLTHVDVLGSGRRIRAMLPPTRWNCWAATGSIPKGDKAAYDVNLITSGVPELSTWAMMIIGFGGVGLQMRRRNSLAVSAAAA